MNHTKNSFIRIIYFIILFIIYKILFLYFGINFKMTMYWIFIFLMFFYYLFNILNFYNQKYKLKDFIYSLLINMLPFSIFYFLDKNIRIIFIFFFYTVIQILLKNFLLRFSQKVENLLIIDSGEYTEKLVDILSKNRDYRYIGYVGQVKKLEENYLGRIEDLNKIVDKESIEIVLFTSRKHAKEYSDLLLKLKMKGIRIVDYISFLEFSEGKIDIEKIDAIWFLMTDGFNTFSNKFQKRIKRIFDIVVSLLILILFSPFILFTYILIKLDIGLKYLLINPLKVIKNPAFFRQKRIGKGGKEFEIIKFRSMKVHDPAKFSKYASECDSRITGIGKFIRKIRLDELPQLINIFKGEMSFIGPRPEWNKLGREYEEKISNYKLRYAVQPGLTGWAQVMYSYVASLEDAKRKLEYDLYYIKHQNFILDLIIFFKTCKKVISGKGK